MRCTSCTREIKPVVAVDIDGTLGEYHMHLMRFALNYISPDEAPVVHPDQYYDGSEPYREWFTREFNVDVTTFRDIKLAYRQGAMKRSMPPIAGAADFTVWLRMRGFEVWLATTRPWQKYDRVDKDTLFWLQRGGFHFDYLLYGDDKYHQLAEQADQNRVVMVLDDELGQCTLAEGLFGPMVPVQIATPFNRNARYTPRVNDFSEAKNCAEVAKHEWEARQL